MTNEQAGGSLGDTGGAIQRHEPQSPSKRVRPRLALAFAWALALTGSLALVGCGDTGDTGDTVAPSGSNKIAPLATVRVPATLPETWTVPAANVRVASHADQVGLVFLPGEEPLTVTLPVPPEAAGAGRISLRVLCDGDFGFGVGLGDYDSRVARSGDTRRLWKELLFNLPGPLAGDALTAPMRIVRASSEQPVLLEAIRFLP